MSDRLPAEFEAILISKSNYRDNDLIVRLLTPALGQVSAIARSARASRRRFGGALDYGNKLSATLRRGRGNSALWHLDEVRLTDGRSSARTDLRRLTLMGYVCEAAAALARSDQPEPRLYGLLDVACLLIEAAPTPPEALFRMAFEAKALTFAGLTPSLTRCVECTEPLQAPPGPPYTYDPHRGGALHDQCDTEGSRRVSERWLSAMEAARRTPLKDLLRARPPGGPQWAFAETIEAHAESSLRSRSVLASLHPHG
ncbi:MAG: DNA repair protein RecO [Myxococcota bacterium]